MTISQHTTRPTAASEWFANRTYRHDQFSDVGALAARKEELGLSLTVVLPTREVADTVGQIIDRIRACGERVVDQILVIDSGSEDGSADVARERGAQVYMEDELMPQFGPAIGKGDAMWRSLSVADGDLVAYLDTDITDFGGQFVYGLLGAILAEPQLQFVKAAYSRPYYAPDGTVLDDAGRVTELTAKPLFNVFYPELTGFGQPLSGEVIARRELLSSIPFCTGYAVETAMLIDVLRKVGLDGMAQVELGARQNRSQPLLALGPMSYAVVRAVLMRVESEGRMQLSLDDADTYLHASCPEDGSRFEERLVKIVERPPIVEALP